MKGNRYGNIVLTLLIIYTAIDVTVHLLLFTVRPDVLATFPMVGEAISEGFNVVFAIAILLILGYGYEEGKPYIHLVIGAFLFYISQLHDFFDEFFILSIPSIAFEVFAFPLALIFATIGIFKIQKYQKKLFDDNETLKIQYREMSITDGLTKLLNTRHFYEIVPLELDVMRLQSRQLSLMLMDIDDFKSVNDTYGHLEGDRLINYIGKMIRDEFSADYQCYRYGGEEFVVVLKDVEFDAGIRLANDFRLKFSQEVFNADGSEYQKTISVGFATLEEKDTIKTLLEKADKAMYDAKTTGKNKVCYR